eukprot:1151493-Pelagomonas_calceolata.AAC.1
MHPPHIDAPITCTCTHPILMHPPCIDAPTIGSPTPTRSTPSPKHWGHRQHHIFHTIIALHSPHNHPPLAAGDYVLHYHCATSDTTTVTKSFHHPPLAACHHIPHHHCATGFSDGKLGVIRREGAVQGLGQHCRLQGHELHTHVHMPHRHLEAHES